MNPPDEKLAVPLDLENEGRLAVLQNFKAEDIQHLGRDDLLAAKTLAGHGAKWGRWTTPESMMNGQITHICDIDLRKRLVDYLAKEPSTASASDISIEDGVLTLTRIALLMKLVPTGRKAKGNNAKRLKAPSIAQKIYGNCAEITARAIRRKADGHAGEGLFQYLTEADVLEFMDYKRTRVEIGRLHTLIARGVWSDAPPQPDIRLTTNPAKASTPRKPEPKPEPHPPLPDEWLAQIGPRVLWVIEDMGPNLLRLLEDMREDFKRFDLQRSQSAISGTVYRMVAEHLARHQWLDSSGQPLSPPFKLTTANGRHAADTCEWPPRTWEHIINLSITLQAAHLFIALLLSAGRISEIATLSRDCVKISRDDKSYLHGFTYKFSDNIFGDART